MRQSTNFLLNQLEKLKLDADEVKQAQLTSQNSGMLGFQAIGARQTVDIPAMSEYEQVLYTVKCKFWAGNTAGIRESPQPGTVVYPSLDFIDVMGNSSDIIIDKSQIGQKLILHNTTSTVIGNAYANYLIDGFTRKNPVEWTSSIITHSSQATRLTVRSDARSTVPGWIEIEVTRA